MHESSDEFEFPPDWTTDCGVTPPPHPPKFFFFKFRKKLHFSVHICPDPPPSTRTTQKNTQNFTSLFTSALVPPPRNSLLQCLVHICFININSSSQLFFIRFFSFLQVTMTCRKARTSSNFCLIGQLTAELAAFECLKKSP